MVLNSKFQIPSTREMFKSLKNARSEWKLKTPMQKWCYFYGIGKATSSILRVSLFNDVNFVHWFNYCGFAYASTTIVLSLYTVSYYAYHGQLQMGLPSTCMAFIFVGHMPLLNVSLFSKRFELQSLIDFGGRYIYHDSREKNEYNLICSDHMDKTMRRFSIKMVGLLISYTSTLIGPAYVYVTYGIRSTTSQARIPFTEENGDAEFFWNFLLQSIIGVHGFIGYIAIELFLSLLENVVTITPQLIRSELVDTIRMYETRSITGLQLNLTMGNIVKQSNDADNYIDRFSKLFYWRNLFTPVAFTYMIGMAIFCQYTGDFHSGYGMACLSWIQLFYVCDLGESIQDNGFPEMLYHTNWEVLPLNIQKAIMLLIHRKQNEEGLSLGPFGMGINRESFKLSTNKVYTFVMFLLNFFG